MFTEKQVEIAEQRIKQVKKLAQIHGLPEMVVVTILSDVKRAEFLNSVEELANTILGMVPTQTPVFEVAPDEKIVVDKKGRVRAKKVKIEEPETVTAAEPKPEPA